MVDSLIIYKFVLGFMRKIIAFLLFINLACSAASSLGEAVRDREECVLARTLELWLDVEVTADGPNLKFSGTKDKLEAAVVKLRDFDKIREQFLPISKKSCTIRSTPKPLQSWEECFAVLGINPEAVRLFNIHGTTDEAGIQLMIPAGDDFNGPVAQLYIDTIIKNSVFCKWIADNFKEQFIASVKTDDGRFLAIRYGLLTQFLCLGDIAITEEVEGKHDGDDAPVQSADCVIPKQSVLKTLVAAGSGAISLERRGGSEYGVRFLSLGEGAGDSYPTVEFVLDTSGSMRYEIATINSTMPKLLEQLQSSFPRVKVRIFSFSKGKKLENEYNLVQEGIVPRFNPLTADGVSTNLAHIASSIPLRGDESSKAVVAFTDGSHEGHDASLLSEAMQLVLDASSKGKISLTRLFRVGKGSVASAEFFSNMSKTVAGCSVYSDSMDDFCATLMSDIYDISRPRTALSLQRAGLSVSIDWVPIDRPGLFKTTARVKDGDSIVDRHGSHLVSLPLVEEQQMLAPVLDAKAARRIERERLLEEQRRLAAEIAALGDDD